MAVVIEVPAETVAGEQRAGLVPKVSNNFERLAAQTWAAASGAFWTATRALLMRKRGRLLGFSLDVSAPATRSSRHAILSQQV